MCPGCKGSGRIAIFERAEDQIEYEKGIDLRTKTALESKGHRFADKPRTLGEVHAIMVDSITGARLGASDPRWADGRAVGY